MGPDPESSVGNQDTGRPVSSGLQVPGEPGHCRARTNPLGELSAAQSFSFKMSFNCTSSNTPR
jgi:hypothetical protein